MSKVKVIVKETLGNYLRISVDYKEICTVPYVGAPELAKGLEAIFDAMDIENVEVVSEKL